MPNAANYKAVLKRYKGCSEQVREYFRELPSLLQNYPYEVTLAYVFWRIEKAQNRSLYCGVLKLHRASRNVADSAVNAQHMTRESFLKLYENVFGHQVKKTTRDKIKTAEKVRDRVIHGKNVAEPEMREALVDVLDYAEAFNDDVDAVAGFEPFGDLRGFKGAGKALESKTSRWLLKGLGFAIN